MCRGTVQINDKLSGQYKRKFVDVKKDVESYGIDRIAKQIKIDETHVYLFDQENLNVYVK